MTKPQYFGDAILMASLTGSLLTLLTGSLLTLLTGSLLTLLTGSLLTLLTGSLLTLLTGSLLTLLTGSLLTLLTGSLLTLGMSEHRLHCPVGIQCSCGVTRLHDNSTSVPLLLLCAGVWWCAVVSTEEK